jgi:rubrerythrin
MATEEESEEATLLKAIETAMELEEYGYTFYRDIRGFVESEKGRALLEFLANEEVEHKAWLKVEREKLQKQIDEGGTTDEKLDIDLPKPWIVFSETDEITAKMDSIEAAKFALDVERKSIQFYSACARMTSIETAKNLFEKLSRYEESHAKLLEENLNYLETEGDWYGYVPILEG